MIIFNDEAKMKKIKCTFLRLVFVCILFIAIFSATPALAGSDSTLISGQTVYVPVYSHIYYGEKSKQFLLAATLSIRNTDPQYPITVLSAQYFDSDGSLVRNYMNEPIELRPMASSYIYVKESDTSGGSGANFIVKWKSEHTVNEPVIESIMIGASAGQGISFVCPGRVIKENN